MCRFCLPNVSRGGDSRAPEGEILFAFQLVGAAGFEPAAPRSQKRGKPSDIKDGSVSSRVVPATEHQSLSGGDRIEVAAIAAPRPSSSRQKTKRPATLIGDGPAPHFLSLLRRVNRAVLPTAITQPRDT